MNFVEMYLSLPKISRKISTGVKEYSVQVHDLDLLRPMLTKQGFEVDAVSRRGEGLDSVVVGRIEAAHPHPKADKLQVCQVNVGENSLRQIVCGAKNARAGLFVAVALPGTKLPRDNGEMLEIVPAKIRDVESAGMLCSRAELGLPVLADVDGDGIWEISEDSQGGQPSGELQKCLGTAVFDALRLRDLLLDLNVTPNRSDVLCHLGVAREIAVGLTHLGKATELKNGGWGERSPWNSKRLVREVFRSETATCRGVTFAADNELGAPAFFLLVEGVSVGPSPAWLRNVLEGIGQNSVNCVVDASNFVLLAFGQPSHAFDLDKLSGEPGTSSQKRLTLRFAKSGERFLGLDGKERTLEPTDCVVADASGPQALLGVIGGEISKVDRTTKNIVIEIANPNPVAVRRTSRRIGRMTDSSFAFEKGIDTVARWQGAVEVLGLINAVSAREITVTGAVHSRLKERSPLAKAFVSDEMLKFTLGPSYAKAICVDGAICLSQGADDEFSESSWLSHAEMLKHRYSIAVHQTHQRQILGAEIVPWDRALRILTALGFRVHEEGEKAHLLVPHWRWLDVSGIADIMEEIVRVQGIDSVPEIPMDSAPATLRDDPHLSIFERAALRASALGYSEIAGFHFMREDDLKKLDLTHLAALGEPLVMMNPEIQDEPLLHTTLIPDLLRKVGRNVGYGMRRGQLFHQARTFQNLDMAGKRVLAENGKALGFAERHGDSLTRLPANLADYAPHYAFPYSQEETQAGRPAETPRLAGVAFGVRLEKTWQNEAAVDWDLHTIMAHALDIALSGGAGAQIEEMGNDHPFAPALHPGKRAVLVAQVSGTQVPVGWVGQFHPRAMREYSIEVPCFGFELNLAALFRARESGHGFARRVVAPRRFPAVSRDFAFVLDENLTAKDLVDAVTAGLAGVLPSQDVPAKLVAVQIFDIYRGKGVPDDKKSIAFNVTVEPTERTLQESNITKLAQAVVRAVSERLGGELRG